MLDMKAKTILIGIFIMLGCYGYGQYTIPREDSLMLIRKIDSLRADIVKGISKQGHTRRKNWNENLSIRGVKWEATKSQVRATEKAKLKRENANALEYAAVIGSDSYTIQYGFLSGKLAEVQTSFDEDYGEYKLYVDEYNELKEVLTLKYGEPDIDTTIIEKEGATSFSTGVDVAEGKIRLITAWFFEKTKIVLYCSGGDGRVYVWVDYEYIPFRRELEKVKEKIKTSDF